MSNRTLSYVFENSKSAGGARCVILTIADITNLEGFGWAGLDKIAKRANMSTDNARLCIQDLQRLGELNVYDRTIKGYQLTCLYQVVMPDTEQKLPDIIGEFKLRPVKPKKERKRKGVEPVQGPQGVEPVQPHGVEPAQALGVEPVQGNPLLDPSKTPQGIGGGLDEEFEELDRPNIFSLYENNIGIITPMMADALIDASKDYPEDWIKEAFQIAVDNQKRSWAYARAILDRWKLQGKDSPAPKPASAAPAPMPQPKPFVTDEPVQPKLTEEEKAALKAETRKTLNEAKTGGANNGR